MSDLYMKAVLTVIAAALVTIAGKEIVPSAMAQFGEGCGRVGSPCYVWIVGSNLSR